MIGRYQGINPSTGKPNYKMSPHDLYSTRDCKKDPRDVMIPCGQCVGCRLDKSRKWADRMMLELDHSKTAVFLTLTYAPECLPYSCTDTPTLVKKHFQDFMKRLRERYSDKEIRFYAAGEYGSDTHRPHYHAIVFGLDLADFDDRKLLFLNQYAQPIFTSDFLALDVWKHGQCSIASVSWQTCAYVARYSMKKVTGDKAAEIYDQFDIEPEFALMSRRPGIAGYFPLDHPDTWQDRRQYISDPNGVRRVTSVYTPDYLLKKLEEVNPELYRTIKLQKSRCSEDSQMLKLSQTDMDIYELRDKEEIYKNQSIKALARNGIKSYPGAPAR